MLNLINAKKQRAMLIKLAHQQKQIKKEENQKRQLKLEQREKIEEEKLQLYNKININFITKAVYNSVIPLNLYTCWHTSDLPPVMRENYNLLVKNNPEFNHYIYDENMCRTFLIENFDNNVIEAYDKLIPCAFKTDLWRYCILYINGGIYIDIKYQCTNNFKLIALTEEEHFIRDHDIKNVYNALIVCKPKNIIMFNTIMQLVKNVQTNFYGRSCLAPTGPGLLGFFFTKEEKQNLELYHSYTLIENKINEYYIVYNNTIILIFYKEYREEQSKNQKKKHYSILWNKKTIYNNIL